MYPHSTRVPPKIPTFHTFTSDQSTFLCDDVHYIKEMLGYYKITGGTRDP